VCYSQHKFVCVLAAQGVQYRRQQSSNDFVNKLKLVNQDPVPRSWPWPKTLTHTSKHAGVNISLPLLDKCPVHHQEMTSSWDGHNAIKTRRRMSAQTS